MPRKLKSQDGNPYEVIRGMWEGAYVSQFVRLFQSKFGFARLSVQDLEDALLDSSCVAVADVVARLLRYLTGRKDIVIENFEKFFEEYIREKKLSIGNHSHNTWQELGPEEKLEDLKWLIDHVYQEKEEDLAEYLDDNFSPEDLRGIRVGQDAFNNTYWYLDDLRLYRENSPKKPSKKDWECVCANLAEWQSFIKQFRKTTNVQERDLYNYLNFNLLPIIQSQLEDLSNSERHLDNSSFFKREQEDTKEMLEKLNCLNPGVTSGSVVDTNSTELLCCENNQNSNNNNAKNRQNNVPKSEDQPMDVSCCAIENSEKNKSDTTGNATVDIKPVAMSNMCANPCGTNCANNCSNMHDGCTCGSVNCPHTPSANTPNRECAQDGNLQLSDNPSESSFSSNKENAPPPAGSSGLGELPPVSAMSNMVGSTGSLGSSASVQPLPSNMLSKSAVPVETQYMQQQSQIFVFSTGLANRAAEAVINGQYSSIISFHCSQPGTKNILEKHPLKVQQFNRQNHALWLNNLAQSKQSGRQMKPGMMNQFGGPTMLNHQYPATPGTGPCHGPCSANVHNMGSCTPHGQPINWVGGNTAGPSDSCNPQQWPQPFPHATMMNAHHRFHGPESGTMRPLGPNSTGGCASSVGPVQGNQPFSGGMPFQSAVHSPGMNQSSVGSVNSSLTGVKIPDENLTPQQRQHREEQLAMIRKMQQLLFPDQHQELQQQQHVGMHGMMPQTGQLRFPGNEICTQQTMEGTYPHHQCINDHDRSQMCTDSGMFPSPGMMAGPQPHQVPPTSISAHLEWHKLHQQFLDEKRRKQNNTQISGTQVSGSPSSQPVVNSPSPSVATNSSTRISAPPPPPPYHTAPCNTMPSPHPASPNTSSLSLASPRTASGLPSPADTSRQFSHPTPPGPRVPQPSPGNSAGCSSMQTTPLNSPKPSVTPSGPPSTGNPAMVRTPTTPSNPNTTPASTPSSILPSPSPGTPISTCGIGNRKQGLTDGQDSSNDFTPISQPSSTSSSNTGDGMFSRHLTCNQTQANQKPMSDCTNTQVNISHKEPSLMPVPSPQQIQYLNAFDGQELTIQKQPNTSLRDLDLVSPTMITNGTMDMSPAAHPQPFPTPDSSQGSFSNLNGPFPSNMDGTPENLQTHFGTAGQVNNGDGGQRRFSLPSPQMTTGFENNPRMVVPSSQAVDGPVPRFSGAHSQNFNSMPRMLVPNQPVIDAQPQRFGNIPAHAHGCGTLQLSTGMDNSVRFPGGISPMETMHRFRGHSPHNMNMDMMNTRMPSPHVGGSNGNMPSSQHYGTVLPCSDHGIPCGPNQPMGGGCFGHDSAHTHLHNLQKMTPSLEVPPASKIAVDSMGSGQGGNGPMFGGGAVVPGLHATSPSNNSQRLTHFDPIASMAAMTETTGPVTTTASITRPPHAMMTSMNVANMNVTNAISNNQPNVVNFHTSMHSIQGMHQEGQTTYNMSNQIGHNMGNGPQTVNNTYVNATMSIQQLNIQNIPTSSYNSSLHIPSMNPSPGMMNQQMNPASVTQTVNSSVAANHPIMHSTVSPKSVSVNMGMGSLRGSPQVQPFSGQPISAQRTMNPMNTPMVSGMMTRTPGAVAPFNSANIHVKANAPNTIQYLPARPQNSMPPASRPPSLDFLQRFATPLTNLDNKVPTHNLQYFPNGNGGTQTMNNMNASLPPTPPSGITPGQPMIGTQRAMNMTVGTMGMRSPAPGQMSQGMNQMYQGVMKVGGRESPIFGRTGSQTGSMQGNMMGIGGPSTGMFPSKQISPTGSAPDASQPLPPSMGQSFNYKHSPFCGPTTADPNYAVQFHNFQQQLYATNTRNSQSSLNSGQNFFTPK